MDDQSEGHREKGRLLPNPSACGQLAASNGLGTRLETKRRDIEREIVVR